MPKKINVFLVVFLLVITRNLTAQQIELFGVVTDSLGNALPNTNILAFAEGNETKNTFAISKNRGEYSIMLQKNILYRLEISYLGYQSISVPIRLTVNKKLDFILQSSINRLDEVQIEYKIPVRIKKDTIIYNTDSFTTGKERKVREILKKLPGIEVDREGNVTAQGERITKVLVDGEIFFTGDSKLAINNIPARVVNQIEILDNYNEIAFLQGLQDTDEKALNIKLKEDKKRFAFGEVATGLGIKNRYVANPSLFYYSPNTNLNFIGDLNNTGDKSFTFKDYIDFEGGYAKLFLDGTSSFQNRINKDITTFLAGNDYQSNTSSFGALNVKQVVANSTEINSFIISNRNKSVSRSQTFNQYLGNGFSSIEKRVKNESLDNMLVLGKSDVSYEPNSSENLKFSLYFKLANNEKRGDLLSEFDGSNNELNTLNFYDSFSIEPSLVYTKKFSLAQTLSASIVWSKSINDFLNDWISQEPFLNQFIEFENSDTFQVRQNLKNSTDELNMLIKDYWVLNSKNHVYTSFNYRKSVQKSDNVESQILEDFVAMGTALNGFGNDVNYNFEDVSLGLEYKFLITKLSAKFGFFFHNYSWRNIQAQNINVSNSTNLILPNAKIKYSLSNSESFSFQYRQNLIFPVANQLANRFVLSDFNQVYLGNPFLSNHKSDNYSLSYRKFNLLKGTGFNSLINYTVNDQLIKRTSLLSGIDRVISPMIFSSPQDEISGILNYYRRPNNVKYSIQINGKYSEDFQIVNDVTNLNISKEVSSKLTTQSFFSNMPNFEVSYKHSLSSYRTSSASFNFNERILSSILEFSLKDVNFKFDYSRVLFSNETENNKSIFDVADASIIYQHADSSWLIELTSSNLFNTQFKRGFGFTDFLIRDRRTFIIPRITLVKLVYKI